MKILVAAVLVFLGVTAWGEAVSFGPVEVVAEGFRFTEGAALAPDGSIYFSDIPNDAIHRFDPVTGETTLLTDDSGGANGLMFDSQGLVACAGKRRGVERYGFGITGQAPSAEPSVLVSLFEGSRLNSPNDLAIRTAGDFFFTDPRYGNQEGRELEGEDVYRATRVGPFGDETEEGFMMEAVVTDLVKPNGIGLSPDGRTLYVADNGAERIMAYPLDEAGAITGEAVLFHDLSDLGGPDGMTVHASGRVFQAVFNGGVAVMSAEGDRLGWIETGPRTTNCVFGADGKTLYVTADGKLKRVVMDGPDAGD